MKASERQDLLFHVNEKMKQLRVEEFLNTSMFKRLRTGLGGSHTVVTYPPLDSLEPFDYKKLLEKVSPVKNLNLYLHIAFCEFLCPFCHYDTEFARLGAEESSKVRSYIDSLKKELEFWNNKISGSTISSLYIGGGTPTAIPEESLLELVNKVKNYFQTEQDYICCVETSPLTTIAEDGPHKLKSLVDAGVNRFSIGVQTFNDYLLRRMRGHGSNELNKALDIILTLLDNVNIDLIQDLPGQNFEHILEDLEKIEYYKPAQVTWYIFRIRPEAAWYGRLRRKSLELTSSKESLRHSLLIREGLGRLGYIEKPGGRFIREPRFSDKFKNVRAGLNSTLLGLGVSAYSHGWGHIYRNVYSKDKINGSREYAERIKLNGFAIQDGVNVSGLEEIASQTVVGIRSVLNLPNEQNENKDYLHSVRKILQELANKGLVISTASNQYQMTELGRLFEEEICSLFYSPQVKNKLVGN